MNADQREEDWSAKVAKSREEWSDRDVPRGTSPRCPPRSRHPPPPEAAPELFILMGVSGSASLLAAYVIYRLGLIQWFRSLRYGLLLLFAWIQNSSIHAVAWWGLPSGPPVG